MNIKDIIRKAFRSSYEKSFNVERKLNKLESNLSEYLKKKNIKLSTKQIDELVEIVSSWFISRVNEISNSDYEVLDLVLEEQTRILDFLNINGLYKVLDKNKINVDFINNDEFRREILFTTQYKILSVLGNKGSEYVLLFEKAFNFDFEPAIRYASYDDGIFSEEYMRFLDTYLKLGGATNAYVLKDYYSGDENNKYCTEELSTIINEVREFKNMQKQKKMDF